MKFRKKPVVIEAVQFNGNNIDELMQAFANNTLLINPIERRGEKTQYIPMVETLEGLMKISVGDWIIKGVRGEYYPCKPDIFEQTYEKVDEQ